MSGDPLNFSQKDIIERQHSKRAARHLKPDLPSNTFAIGDIVFSNSDRSKLKARDKLVVREYLGSGQYRLDRLCGKSTYITSTVKPDYDLYTVEKAEETCPSEPAKSVTWNDNNTTIDSKDETPTPDRGDPANDTNPSRSRPVTRASLLQRRPRTEPPRRRPLPPAPGKAASYCPQSEHQVQTSPQPAVRYLITPGYESDEEDVTPPTIVDPPQNEPEEPTDPDSPDTDSEDSDRDVFHSPGGSPHPQDSPEHNDPEQTDQSEGSEQETPSENPPQSNPQAQAGPSSKPDPRPDAQPAVPYTSIFRKNPRKKAPIKRNRSTSHPPAQQPPGDKTFIHPPSQKQPRSARLPPPESDQHGEPPPATDREARPRRTSRSGRTLIQPTKLTYLPNFAQYDTRDPPPDFRLPGPMAQKPSKPPSSTDV